MASTRTKSTYEFTQDAERASIKFNEPADYVMVDINPRQIIVSLGFIEKPYDELITIKLNSDVNVKESKYTHDKSGNKLVSIDLCKQNQNDEFKLTASHKMIEKKNHPKADPRGYSVKKPVAKNWDKVIANLEDSEEEEPDANTALKKIYDSVDDDTRRAMEKSMYESNGTVLNMNWGEVGKGKVEPYKPITDEELKNPSSRFNRN